MKEGLQVQLYTLALETVREGARIKRRSGSFRGASCSEADGKSHLPRSGKTDYVFAPDASQVRDHQERLICTGNCFRAEIVHEEQLPVIRRNFSYFRQHIYRFFLILTFIFVICNISYINFHVAWRKNHRQYIHIWIY